MEISSAEDNPTIADLLANITPAIAGDLMVYDNATGGSVILPTGLLTNGVTYFIEETDTDTGCSGTERLAVVVQINDPTIPLIDASADFCFLDNAMVADLNAFINSGTNVLWFENNTSDTPLDETTVLVTNEYYAKEQDQFGCLSAFSNPINVQVNDNPLPVLDTDGNLFCGIEEPTITDLQANLTVASGLTLNWYSEMIDGDSVDVTTPLEDNATYYVATFNSITNCESSERLAITVDLTDCDPEDYPLLIPDGFSPNGDGINDVFDLQGVEFLYENYTIEIYNRYGTPVYKGDIDTPPWDGTSNQMTLIGDDVLPNGVYFYVIYFNRDEREPEQGTVYLNR